MDRVNINWEPEGVVSASLFVRYNYDDTDTPQPDSYSFSSAQVAAFYGTGTYGTSAYGSSGFPLERVSVEGSGFVVAFKLEDKSKDILINGFVINNGLNLRADKDVSTDDNIIGKSSSDGGVDLDAHRFMTFPGTLRITF